MIEIASHEGIFHGNLPCFGAIKNFDIRKQKQNGIKLNYAKVKLTSTSVYTLGQSLKAV
jgi:hypothetical protein